MCLYPRLLKNKKYLPNKKNKGKIPTCYDERVRYVSVGCGKCIECMKKRAREWQVRLHEEITKNEPCHFVTLTFNEESIIELTNEIYNKYNLTITEKTQYNEIAIIAVRRFLERWRKLYKKSIKHWLITELGHTGTERIHLHGLLWGDKTKYENIWKYGWVYIGDYVNNKTINYIIKYVTKIDLDHKNYQPIILTSPGIGNNYTNKHNAQLNKFNDEVNKETNELYTTKEGFKLPLPIYYRNKLYNEDEREELWLQKLNKEERYILGKKISIKTPQGQKLYELAQKEAQKKSKQLGYGDDSKDYNISIYKKHSSIIKNATKRLKSKKKY